MESSGKATKKTLCKWSNNLQRAFWNHAEVFFVHLFINPLIPVHGVSSKERVYGHCSFLRLFKIGDLILCLHLILMMIFFIIKRIVVLEGRAALHIS